MTELKPCPFCGGEAESYSYEAERDIFDSRSLGYVDTEYFDMWGCWCKECEAMIPEKRTEAEAIEAWNRRVEWPAKCGDCANRNGNGRPSESCLFCARFYKDMHRPKGGPDADQR